MDCIKPGHRTRQGPGQDGQCQQAAEIDKIKEEAAETHGSAPAAASTTLKVEASNGLADWTATSTFRPKRPTLSQGGRTVRIRFPPALSPANSGRGETDEGLGYDRIGQRRDRMDVAIGPIGPGA